MLVAAVLVAAVLVAGALPAASATAAAAPGGGWSWSGEGGLASDGLFRGVDQTRGRGEAFGGAELDGPTARLGLFAANVVVPGSAGAADAAEVDLYGGWLSALAGFDTETGAIAYLVSGTRSRPDLAELYAKIARTLGPARFGATASYATLGEAGARDGYVELNASDPLTPKWTVSGAVGHLYQDRPGVLDAFAAPGARHSVNDTVWSAGVAYSLTERIGLELRWTDSDHTGPSYPSRLVATLRARLF